MKNNDLRKLVLARLETMPSNLNINMGDKGILRKKDLISHVKNGDDLGQKIIDMQLKYLQSMKCF